MRKQIFHSICIVAAIAIIALLALTMGVLYNNFSEAQQQTLKTQTELTSHAVEDEGMKYLKSLKKTKSYRITWIDSDGTVLYDNQESAEEMGNHANREEFKEAMKTGTGKSDRYSDTLMQRYFYYAKKLNDGSVLRMSMVQNSIFVLMIRMIRPMVAVLALIVLAALFLASRLAKHIVDPLNNLNLEHPLSNDVYDEVSPLLNRIDSQQKQLYVQQVELQRRKEEFDTVTSNMNEGLVLLNADQQIIMMNHMARDLLGAQKSDVGNSIHVVHHFYYIEDLLADPQQKEITKEVADQDYVFSVSSVRQDNIVQGYALFMRNVTEQEQAEKIRREFTANVSHELKTPLHTIRGCAELMMNGMVKPQDEIRFEQQIYKEAQRMIDLVEDIISLSHLDEGINTQKERVDLYQVASTTIDSLQENASKKGIEIHLDGSRQYIQVVPQLIFSVVYNLCDNAIKYNVPNGQVDIIVEKKDGHVQITVKDTGIGIPQEDQSRIFERFYRVDKSRSKAVGGTGLGLSIVKHSLKQMHANLQMKSQVGQGTEMRVIF